MKVKVRIINEKSVYKGQIHDADYREDIKGFAYRIELNGMATYWKDSEVEVVERIKHN